MNASRFSKWIVNLTGIVAVCWVIGRQVKDVDRFMAPLYYFPAILVLLISIVSCMVLIMYHRPFTVMSLRLFILLVCIILLAPLRIFRENHFTGGTDSVPATAFRLVHWNVYWGRFGWEELAATLKNDGPDILAINESPPELTVAEIKSLLGDASSGDRRGTFGFGIRGVIADSEVLLSKAGVTAIGYTCEIDSTQLRIICVDISAALFNPRYKIIRELMDAAAAWKADIIVGDFNTPRHSAAMQPLPYSFHHAYDVAGSGWSSTFPVPVPLLSIDQCIIGARIDAHHYELPYSLRSDHVRQILDFSVREHSQEINIRL